MSYEKTSWAAGDKVTSAKLNKIENQIAANEAKAEANSAAISQQSTVINNQNSRLDTMENKVLGNSASISAQAAQLLNLQELITQANTNLGAANRNIAANTTAIENNANAIANTNANVATNNAAIELANSKITSNTEALTEVQNRLTTAEATIVTQGESITNVSNNLTSLTEQVEQNVDVINDNAIILDNTINDVEYLLSKVYMLESKIEDMRKTNVVAKAVALNEFPETQSTNIMDNILTLNQTGEDVALTTSETITGKVLVVNAQSVTAKNMEMDSSKFTSKCSGDIVIDNFTSTGTLVKTSNGNTNKAFDLVSGEYVTIKNCTFGMTSYNTLEIGLGGSNPDPKGVLIDNCVFEKNSNNSILIFGATDNAQITVSNCHFKACSNALRYSNKNNSKNVTINFINCQFDELEARPNMQMWKAVFIAENYTSKAATWVEDNLFAPEKVAVNFVNCTYEGQPIVAQENQADYWNLGGTPEAGKQYLGTMCYDLFSHESLDANGIPLEYHADRLPVITVK